MFHGFDYPDETGKNELWARFWRPVMRQGVIEFPRPEVCEIRKYIRPMYPKIFSRDKNNYSGDAEEGLS
jgi:CRISPR-associated protein Cas5d